MKYKICCCTGHRPNGFLWDYENKDCAFHKKYLEILEYAIEQAIVRNNFNYFVSGGAIGADMDFAETVIRLREKYPHIQLEIAVPCADQDLKWHKSDKKRYHNILERADRVTILSPYYYRGCMHQRNRYMVDKSDLIIAIWNESQAGGTYTTLQYAEKRRGKHDKYIDYILLPNVSRKKVEYTSLLEIERNKEDDFKILLAKLHLPPCPLKK